VCGQNSFASQSQTRHFQFTNQAVMSAFAASDISINEKKVVVGKRIRK
jgi:hypothetical protein